MSIKHPQGFREGGVRGGRERGHMGGWMQGPWEPYFAQKVTQNHSYELPLPKKLEKDVNKCLQGCHVGRFIEILTKMTPQGRPKWSKMQYSHHDIAIFTSCPKSPKWCPKGSKMRALGPPNGPKWSQVGPQRSPGVPKVGPNVQKDHLGKLPGTQVGPKVAQVPSRVHF